MDGSIDDQAGQYTVRRGDSLSKIAKFKGTTVKALQEANGIKNPDQIKPGQILKIPGKAVPVVTPPASPGAFKQTPVGTPQAPGQSSIVNNKMGPSKPDSAHSPIANPEKDPTQSTSRQPDPSQQASSGPDAKLSNEQEKWLTELREQVDRLNNSPLEEASAYILSLTPLGRIPKVLSRLGKFLKLNKLSNKFSKTEQPTPLTHTEVKPQVEKSVEETTRTDAGGDFKHHIDIDISDFPRSNSAKKTDPMHSFPDILDNYVKDATKFKIPTKGPGGTVTHQADLYQVEGSLNGKAGIFEWIVDKNQVTHRRFIPNGKVTGYPNQKK